MQLNRKKHIVLICSIAIYVLLSKSFSLKANSIDSLYTLLDSSTGDTSIELILNILEDHSEGLEQMLPSLKTRALEICDRSDVEDCHSRIYTKLGSKLAHLGDMKQAEKIYGEWLSWAIMENNIKAEGLSSFYHGKLKFGQGKLEESLVFLKKAKEIFLELPQEQKYLFEIDNLLASCYRDKGDFEKAEDLYRICLSGAKKMEDKRLLASTYNCIGRLYRKRSVNDSARINYMRALEISKELDDKKVISKISNNLGNIFHIEGNLEKAMEFYIVSKNAKEDLNYTKGIAISYLNIGAVRFDLREYELAKEDFQKSLDLATSLDAKILMIHNYLKIGNVYRELENFDEAINYHQLAISSSKLIEFEEGILKGNNSLGEDYLKIKLFGAAYNCFKVSLELAEKNERKNFVSGALIRIAECYMGEEDKDSFNEMNNEYFTETSESEIEQMLLKGANLAMEIDAAENMIISFDALRMFYKKTGQYQKEAEAADFYLAYRDSLFEKQRVSAIAEWSTKYETAEKEKEILLLHKENELQQLVASTTRNNFIGVFLISLLGGIGIFIYFFLQNKVKRVQQIENLRTKISSDLHDDVGSMLSGLAMQAELLEMTSSESEKPKLQRIAKIGRSAMLQMRDAVWAMDARQDHMSDLVDRMREFAEETLVLKGIKYEFKIENVNLEKKILPDLRQNLYLIFKEALTNIIKHSNATEVTLIMKNNGDSFNFQIIDNGAVQEKNYKTTGLGTSNMKMRADRIKAHLEIKIQNGFGVYLVIPAV